MINPLELGKGQFYIKHEDTDLEMSVTHEKILTIRNTLGVMGDDLADILTTLNPDSYADKITDILSEGETIADAIEYDPEGYETCRSYHRIMNCNLTDEQCEEAWIESCNETLSE